MNGWKAFLLRQLIDAILAALSIAIIAGLMMAMLVCVKLYGD